MRAFEISGADVGGIPTIGGKEMSAARMLKRGLAALSQLRPIKFFSTITLKDAIFQKISSSPSNYILHYLTQTKKGS
ncbi:MAG: hypothetical protein COW65_07955 [Cytophagales bacterium CG18_big_fil_WC_8_21_14_2_50_42_9]|nr:MAG: hypothetical protein COW65_07955 [Cytophagales bacterium CG18_big_fil_WC_8_21_14_2_50_42_9]